MAFKSLYEALKNSERFIEYCPSVVHIARYLATKVSLTELKSYEVEDWQKVYQSLVSQPDLQRHFFLVCWDIANEPSYEGDELIAVAILFPLEEKKELELAEAA